MGENIINLISSKLGIGLILSIILSLVSGPIAIPLLRKLKFGQNIREEGHLKKAGTPTMGGVIFILSSVIVMLILGYKFNDKAMIALYSLIAFGFIGFLDDLLKILKKQSEGLKPGQKMILLLIFSIALAIYGYYNLNTNL